LKVAAGLLLFLSLFIQNSTAEEISFYVPEDHEKYQFIDSLYQLIDTTKQIIIQKEAGLIKEKSVREDVWEIKKRYLNYLLEHKVRDTAAVLGYCTAIQTHFEIKKQYFKELLSALEGDIRAKCFIFWKSARKEYSQIRNYISGLAIKKGTASTIQYDTAVQTDMTLDIKEPSVNDVLGLEEQPADESDPFAGTEYPIDEVERGDRGKAASENAQDIPPGKKLEGMVLKKSDILADIKTDTEEEGTSKGSFQEDMLKALSVKKSENETDLDKVDKAETNTDSQEKGAGTDVVAEKKKAVSTPKPEPVQSDSQREKVEQSTPVKKSPTEKATDDKKK
jgi:hypothetical protein